ncbi:MAG: sugar phosphate isomerase/epimerase [Oscillospiraceae bacterium]|jgi:sugar phosphate isomerase/epimerase|nr:sugar phosphate isomerase/epimerase [Oscillospiraceae bacterium]
MKLGIISGTEKQDFAHVQSLGLRYAEFCINVGDDAKIYAARAEEIKGYSEACGVQVASIGRWGTTRLAADGSAVREEYENDLALIDLACALGCPNFVCGCNRASEAFTPEENAAFAVAYFRALTDYAAAKNVRVLVYNCDWNNFIYDKTGWDLVLGQVPGLGIKYDPSHCINRDGDFLQEMLDYGQHIGHFHVKGTVRIHGKNIPDPPAGLDDIPWGAVIALLYTHGYDGVLSIEPHSSVWSAGALGAFGVRFTIEYFKKYIMEDSGAPAPAKQFMP